jgi:hypothetical protein
MPIGLSQGQGTPMLTMALNAAASRNRAIYKPEVDFNQALQEADRQSALNQLSLAKAKTMGQREYQTGVSNVGFQLGDVARQQSSGLSDWKREASAAVQRQSQAASIDQQFREMRLRNAYGGYNMAEAGRQNTNSMYNTAIGGLANTAASAYTSWQQKQTNNQMQTFLDSLNWQGPSGYSESGYQWFKPTG